MKHTGSHAAKVTSGSSVLYIADQDYSLDIVAVFSIS
jgi:hypothetical protein